MADASHSLSNIKDFIASIIKKHETLTAVPPIYFYINRINNRLEFKIKNVCELELQTPATMNLFEITKKSNRKNKTLIKCVESWGKKE